MLIAQKLDLGSKTRQQVLSSVMLQIGLAVGDIESIQKNAELRLLIVEVRRCNIQDACHVFMTGRA